MLELIYNLDCVGRHKHYLRGVFGLLALRVFQVRLLGSFSILNAEITRRGDDLGYFAQRGFPVGLIVGRSRSRGRKTKKTKNS